MLIGLFYLGILVSQKGPLLLYGSNDEITAVLNNFSQNHRPLIQVNFSALYGQNGRFEVLHPLLDRRNLKIRDQNPICSEDDQSDKKINQSFLKLIGTNATDEEFPQKHQLNRKLDALAQFLNNKDELPENFVSTPPFIDDQGNSFAYVLMQKSIAPFNQKTWVEQHLSFFKISELEKVLLKFQIYDLRYWVISRLSETETEDLIKANSLVVTKDYLFIKNQSRFGFSPLSYWVYDLRDFHSNLKNSKYDLAPFIPGLTCLYRTGNGCWTYSSEHTMSYLYKYSVVIVILAGLIVLILLVFYFRHIYFKNKEQQKNRFALQVLSHEFRTPVSSMLLMVDRLSARTSKFTTDEQDLVTRISAEVFRLQRIIEVSKTYLQAESHRVHFNHQKIESINNWIVDFVADSNLHLEYVLLPVDQELRADPFWLKFVLSNLIQNALTHGKPPVYIRLNNSAGKIKISVEDQGSCEFASLNEMTDAFVKSGRSKGMGLGLNIVKSILDDWGVEIQFSTRPTSFSLVFTKPSKE